MRYQRGFSMNIEAQYAIELLAALIANKPTPMPPTQLNWEEFFAFSVNHKVDNMMYVALSQLDNADIPIMDKLMQKYSFGIALEAAQEISFQELIEEFEKEGIKNLPLKGCLLKHLYPMPDYRQSGDIDILIHKEDFKAAASILTKLGYTEDEFDENELHLGYRRPPNVMIEIHGKLVEDGNRTSEYLSQIWDNVHLCEGSRFGYEMDKETTYAYIIAHMAKHIKNTGAGIRLVLDIWVLLMHWQDEFDKDKLCGVLAAMKLTDFEKMASKLARHWFGGEIIDDENVIALGEFTINSGIYGNNEAMKMMHASDVDDDRVSRAKYKIKKFCKSTFLPVSTMRVEYPILLKYKFLLPVMWLHRIFKLLFSKEMKVSDRIKKSVEIKDDAKILKDIWESVK